MKDTLEGKGNNKNDPPPHQFIHDMSEVWGRGLGTFTYPALGGFFEKCISQHLGPLKLIDIICWSWADD